MILSQKSLALGILVAVSACAQPRPEAQILRSCGPLDGSAFEVGVPDGDRTIRLMGPGWPEGENAVFAIDPEDRTEDVSIYRCTERGDECERAASGSFVLTQAEAGSFSGTLQAVFAEAGSRRIAFTAFADEDAEPEICG